MTELCGCEEAPVRVKFSGVDARDGVLLVEVGFCLDCLQSRGVRKALSDLELDGLGDLR